MATIYEKSIQSAIPKNQKRSHQDQSKSLHGKKILSLLMQKPKTKGRTDAKLQNSSNRRSNFDPNLVNPVSVNPLVGKNAQNKKNLLPELCPSGASRMIKSLAVNAIKNRGSNSKPSSLCEGPTGPVFSNKDYTKKYVYDEKHHKTPKILKNGHLPLSLTSSLESNSSGCHTVNTGFSAGCTNEIKKITDKPIKVPVTKCNSFDSAVSGMSDSKTVREVFEQTNKEFRRDEKPLPNLPLEQSNSIDSIGNQSKEQKNLRKYSSTTTTQTNNNSGNSTKSCTTSPVHNRIFKPKLTRKHSPGNLTSLDISRLGRQSRLSQSFQNFQAPCYVADKQRVVKMTSVPVTFSDKKKLCRSENSGLNGLNYHELIRASAKSRLQSETSQPALSKSRSNTVTKSIRNGLTNIFNRDKIGKLELSPKNSLESNKSSRKKSNSQINMTGHSTLKVLDQPHSPYQNYGLRKANCSSPGLTPPSGIELRRDLAGNAKMQPSRPQTIIQPDLSELDGLSQELVNTQPRVSMVDDIESAISYILASHCALPKSVISRGRGSSKPTPNRNSCTTIDTGCSSTQFTNTTFTGRTTSSNTYTSRDNQHQMNHIKIKVDNLLHCEKAQRNLPKNIRKVESESESDYVNCDSAIEAFEREKRMKRVPSRRPTKSKHGTSTMISMVDKLQKARKQQYGSLGSRTKSALSSESFEPSFMTNSRSNTSRSSNSTSNFNSLMSKTTSYESSNSAFDEILSIKQAFYAEKLEKETRQNVVAPPQHSRDSHRISYYANSEGPNPGSYIQSDNEKREKWEKEIIRKEMELRSNEKELEIPKSVQLLSINEHFRENYETNSILYRQVGRNICISKYARSRKMRHAMTNLS